MIYKLYNYDCNKSYCFLEIFERVKVMKKNNLLINKNRGKFSVRREIDIFLDN